MTDKRNLSPRCVQPNFTAGLHHGFKKKDYKTNHVVYEKRVYIQPAHHCGGCIFCRRFGIVPLLVPVWQLTDTVYQGRCFGAWRFRKRIFFCKKLCKYLPLFDLVGNLSCRCFCCFPWHSSGVPSRRLRSLAGSAEVSSCCSMLSPL